MFEQNQHKVYREVLVAGDLSKEDGAQAAALPEAWSAVPYGKSMSDTTEFIYGNDTVYFAQPSLSQFVPGGSGAGVFNQPATIGLRGTPNNPLPLTGRDAPTSNTGAVLRYVLVGDVARVIHIPLDTLSGESGFTAKNCLILK